MGPENKFADLRDVLAQSHYFHYPARAGSERAEIVAAGSGKTADSITQQTLLRKQIAIRIRTDFKSKLEDLRGSCYPTEVRDSGVLVCGIHHSLWDADSEGCATMEEELVTLTQIATDALLGFELQPAGPPKPRTIAEDRLKLLEMAMNGVRP